MRPAPHSAAQYGYTSSPISYYTPSSPTPSQKTRTDIGVGFGRHVYVSPPKKKCGIVKTSPRS